MFKNFFFGKKERITFFQQRNLKVLDVLSLALLSSSTLLLSSFLSSTSLLSLTLSTSSVLENNSRLSEKKKFGNVLIGFCCFAAAAAVVVVVAAVVVPSPRLVQTVGVTLLAQS